MNTEPQLVKCPAAWPQPVLLALIRKLHDAAAENRNFVRCDKLPNP